MMKAKRDRTFLNDESATGVLLVVMATRRRARSP
jgi:hypothetical protein